MRNHTKTDSYEVGYGKPPKGGRFKKGVSGNPCGRPKKASDFGSKLIRELDSELIINENGKRRTIKKHDGVVKQLVNTALSGNLPAKRLLLALYQHAVEIADEQWKNSPYNPNIKADDLTDDQLAEIILREEFKETTRNGKNGRQAGSFGAKPKPREI